MSTEQQIPDTEFAAALAGARFFIGLSVGNIVFKYGPYSAEYAGNIVKRCVVEGIPAVMTAEMGADFDWDLARSMLGDPNAVWRTMEEAPRDGSVIIGDVMGVETKVTWWLKWECWREVADNNTDVGRPVDVIRWRAVTEKDQIHG